MFRNALMNKYASSNPAGRASYSMLEDSANLSSTATGALLAGAASAAIAKNTEGGKEVARILGSDYGGSRELLKLLRLKAVNNLLPEGRKLAIDRGLTNSGANAVLRLSELISNKKARTAMALVGGSAYGGALIGNHIFHNYADRY